MKNRLLFFFIAILFNNLSASAQSWLWGVQGEAGLKADLFSRNVATNKTGNVYHTGRFQSSINFGAYTLSTSANDVYLVKYDANGNALWARQSLSSNNIAVPFSVTSDDSDNSYVTGYAGDTTMFGKYTLFEKRQLFLVKYDANGNLIWVKQPDTTLVNGAGLAVTTDKFGHEYVTGKGIFLMKFDRNGNIIWTIPQTNHTFGKDSIANEGNGVATDLFGNVFISGQFSGALNFGSYHLYSENLGGFIAKFDSSGNVLWAYQSSNTSANNYVSFNTHPPIYSVAVSKQGAAYLTASYSDSITFGYNTFTPLPHVTNNFFVLKYNADGTIAWGRQASAITTDSIQGWGTYSIYTDDSNHIYISGATSEGSGDPFVFSNDTISINRINYDDAPSFILKLDTFGNVLCSSMTEAGGWEANAVTVDSTGKYVYIGGGFAEYLYFGKDTLACTNGAEDPYVGRWQPCYKKCNLAVSASPQSATICGGQSTLLAANGGTSYTWGPVIALSASTGDTVTVSPTASVTYTVTINAANGCSEILPIPITTIAAPNVPTITVSITGDSLVSSALSYNQWYFNGDLLTGDTGRVLVIKGHAKGWYKVVVTNPANGCSTTSDSTTSINQLSVISEQLSVYPNPFNNIIYVKINSAASNVSDWSLQVTDVLGRTVFVKPSLSYSNEIELSNLPGGVYFISVVSKTGRAVFPVVKQ